MHSQFTPFTLDKLDKGKLLDEINHDMAKLQTEIAAYAERYGAEAEKAKAVLTLKIAVICVSPASRQYAVKVESVTTMPKRPSDIAVAFLDEDEDAGTTEMVVRTFDNHKEPPGPRLPFSDEDGEKVDDETGEVTAKRKTPAKAGL